MGIVKRALRHRYNEEFEDINGGMCFAIKHDLSCETFN